MTVRASADDPGELAGWFVSPLSGTTHDPYAPDDGRPVRRHESRDAPDVDGPAEVIRREFDAGTAPGWSRGEIDVRYAGTTSEISSRAFTADGALVHPRIHGTALGRAVDELRDRFAQPGTGAWFSVRIELSATGGFSLDADYDDEPAWRTPTDPGHYLEEQQRHPRDLEHQPEWYRRRLAEARAR